MKKNSLFYYRSWGAILFGCFFITSCIGCGGRGSLKILDENLPTVIVKDTNVVLGDSVHVVICMPGHSKKVYPVIFIDTINGIATGKQYVPFENDTGFYNDLPTKVGVNVFSGTIIDKKINSNKLDTFHFHNSYNVTKPKS